MSRKTTASMNALHAQYHTILPAIETHGRIFFRHLRCPHQRADAIQEMRSLAWKWLVRLTQQGKNVDEFLSTFVTLLARAVHSGRKLTGMERSKDVMNPITQNKRRFKVESLSSPNHFCRDQLYGQPRGQQEQDVFEERLQDNTITPVPDQVQFRLDFPAFLRTLTGRERRMIKAMARNERTSDLGKEFDLSAGRISQMRQEFCKGWNRFCGEEVS